MPAKETTLRLHTLLHSVKSRRSPAGAPRPSGRPRVGTLEDRSVPAVLADPVGDFLPTCAGPHDPGLDVVAHEMVFLRDQGRLACSGRTAGPAAPAQAKGGLYLFGVDRGRGCPVS
jgi:hypothetical protein